MNQDTEITPCQQRYFAQSHAVHDAKGVIGYEYKRAAFRDVVDFAQIEAGLDIGGCESAVEKVLYSEGLAFKLPIDCFNFAAAK